MINKDNFAVFILSYGRANKVTTYNMIRKYRYTNKIYIICSTDDKQLPLYKEKYGDEVIVFDKNDYKGKFDIGDNFDNDNVVVFARNAVWDIAKNLGLKYFLELDDDYRYIYIHRIFNNKVKTIECKDINQLIAYFIDYLENTPVKSIGFSQFGDYIGGATITNIRKLVKKRKIMNCFFNKVDRPYYFYGRINEDVNCYIANGKTGDIFLTIPCVVVRQRETQSNSGGLTDYYLEHGTYIKSFYTIMFNPSAVKIKVMITANRRLHHFISWNNAVPCIIEEKYKK